MKTTITLRDAFNRMQENKQVRITPEYRKDIKGTIGNYFTDQWFHIAAVHSDDTVTLCGNHYTILKGTKLSDIKFP